MFSPESYRCHSDFDPLTPSSSLWRGEVHPNPIEMAPTPQAFWSELEGAKEYDETLEKKKQQDPETHGDRTWRVTALKQPVGHGSGGIVTARFLPTCLK